MLHRRPARRCRGDAGTTLIEFSIVIPVLTIVVCGIVDFGMLYRQDTIVIASTGAGVRAVASAGSARAADFVAVRAVLATLAGTSRTTVVKVVTFQANEGSSQPLSPSCFTASNPASSARCNVYTAAQLQDIGAVSTVNFGPSSVACGAAAWDRNWCPLSRNDSLVGPQDYVGVYVEATGRSVTGFWMPSGWTITDRSIMRLEPKVPAS